jgi:protein MAK11
MEALPIRTNANLLNGLPPGTPAPLGADDEAKISFRIVLGSYERFLYGIDAVFSESDESNEDGNSSSEKKLPTLRLHPRFIHPAHTSSIKSLALHPSGLLASGSTDETIRLHSLPRKKELGTLEAQRGTITSLSFTGAHLVSAAEDGTVGVYRKKDWEEVKTISSGKKEVAIRDLAVHPSGRLALGVCSDGYLRFVFALPLSLATLTHLCSLSSLAA